MATLRRFPGVYTTLSSGQEFIAGNTPQPVTPPPDPPAPPVFVDPTVGLDLFGFNSFGPMGGITSITFNTTSSIPGFDIETDPELISVHFPNLVSVDPTNIQGGFISLVGNTSLTTVDLPVFLPTPTVGYDLSGNALDVASVNNFLRRCMLNVSYTSGSINLSGGTNAAPTGQGLTDKAALIVRGVTVTTN